MYYIYIRNHSMFKKIKPYKLYGTYETAVQTYDVLNKLNVRKSDIILKRDDKIIEYVDLVNDVSKNSEEYTDLEKIDNYIEKVLPKNPFENIVKITEEPFLTLGDPFIKKPKTDEDNNQKILQYKILEASSKELIMSLKITDKVEFILKDSKKFNELMSSSDIFKFEFYSLKSVRKIINEETLNKDEIYRTLMLTFNNSIENSLIIITEGI